MATGPKGQHRPADVINNTIYNQASGISAGRKLADALARQIGKDPVQGTPAHR